MPTQYQPKTGAPCHCRRGQQRDNCPACEGTGWRIDFAAIRARRLAPLVNLESPAFDAIENTLTPEQ